MTWQLALVLTFVTACAAPDQAVHSIRIVGPPMTDRELRGDSVSVEFGSGANGDEVLHSLMRKARQRGASRVTELEVSLRYESSGRIFDCRTFVGFRGDVVRRAERALATPGAFRPERVWSRTLGSIRKCEHPRPGAKCWDEPGQRKVRRYQDEAQNKFKPVLWNAHRKTYGKLDIAPVRVCVPATQPIPQNRMTAVIVR